MKQTITFLFFAIFTLAISAQTVNIQGDPYGGNPYSTITDAITASNDGDVILITGVHTEPISISKSITLRGTDPNTDIIQAAASASSDGTGSRVVSLAPPVNTDILTITIENLGIRNGNFNVNGGGINADKIMGLLTLNNLIITDNYTTTNGGAIGIAGSNVNITNCTIQNNSSALDGGAIIAAPNNNSGNGINSILNIKQSLINSNSGRNGGGIYINGNKTFGDNYKIDVNIENTTISNNNSTNAGTASALAGGGAICSNSQALTTNPAIGNVTLNLIHSTLYGNTCPTAIRSGIQCNSVKVTNFSAYNSIIVAADDVNVKAINFANTNISNIINCIFGGTNLPPTIVSDPAPNANNNEVGKTATQAGLTGTLSSEGGKTQVLVIGTGTTAENYCSVATGVTIPTIDQRGYTRTGTYDAGAYELDGTLSIGDITKNISVKIFPNPTREFVKISGLNTVNSVRIYSILGTLEKVIHNQKEFNISNLSSGIHLMVIESEGQNIVKRMIKK